MKNSHRTLTRTPGWPLAVLLVLGLALVAGTSNAQQHRLAELRIDEAWARPLPPVAKNGAAYLRITSSATQMDRLLSASSPIAERIEFHTSVAHGTMMMMKALEAVNIPAGATVTLAPGGIHLMLLGMKKPLVAGDHFTLTLNFEHGGTTVVSVAVEARSNAGHGTNHGKAAH